VIGALGEHSPELIGSNCVVGRNSPVTGKQGFPGDLLIFGAP
jgi:carbonic anhydrase/acetyltransferase-like protein (isoleucine patch superfamily)